MHRVQNWAQIHFHCLTAGVQLPNVGVLRVAVAGALQPVHIAEAQLPAELCRDPHDARCAASHDVPGKAAHLGRCRGHFCWQPGRGSLEFRQAAVQLAGCRWEEPRCVWQTRMMCLATGACTLVGNIDVHNVRVSACFGLIYRSLATGLGCSCATACCALT